MIAFKKRAYAQRICNAANTLPGVRLIVLAVPQGWVVTKDKGVKHG